MLYVKRAGGFLRLTYTDLQTQILDLMPTRYLFYKE